MKKILIIGAGLGGLATAALLAKQGYDVTVFEKNSTPGGRARVLKKNGFTFDMGPSWYLMPDVFERFFTHFNKQSSDFYTLVRMNPAYRMFFAKKNIVDIDTLFSKNKELFESFEKNGSEKLEDYTKDAEKKYTIAMKHFIYKSYSTIFDFFDSEAIKNGATLNVFESIDTHVKRFFSSEIARKVLLYNIVFLGGNPQNTPALYSLMAHIDFTLGVWYPMGGMGKVVEALTLLVKENGVKIYCNSDVTKICVKNKKAYAVMINNKKVAGDIIVANADYPFVENNLLEKQYQTYRNTYWKKRTIAPSAFIVYLGVKGKIKNLRHHNLFVENDWMKHFDSIFKNPSWPDEFSYYVCCPSKTDASTAPKNCENLFALIPVASGIPDSAKIRDTYYHKLLGMLEHTLGEKISDRIMVKHIFTVNDFTHDYNAYRGTALGLTHTLLQSALFRPKMQSKKVKNLFYVGQYTHPGIGVPMALIASEIVTEVIKKYDTE